MPGTLPPPLMRLLTATTARQRESAWEDFVREYSALLLNVARSLGGSADDVMDRYVHVLEGLRCDTHRKLRSYSAQPQATFTTWLALVARNLCHDHHRQRYGRRQSGMAEAVAASATRRRLIDLVAVELESIEVADGGVSPELRLRAKELRRALGAALNCLEPHERLLVRLRFEDGLSVPQVARITGYANVFALYRKLDRILAHLRARLHAAGIEDPVA